MLVAQSPDVIKQDVPRDFRPVDFKIGFNIVRSGQTWIGAGKDSQELAIALALYKYNLAVDYGTEENKRGAGYSYINKGRYFRAGIDKNFVKDQKSGDVLSLGLRYARSNFEDELIYSTDVGFGHQNIRLTNADLQAGWIELVFNLRAKIVSNLYSGFTLRWQFGTKVSGEGALKTFDIPGFGTTKRKNSTKFDYYVMWRISLSKSKFQPELNKN